MHIRDKVKGDRHMKWKTLVLSLCFVAGIRPAVADLINVDPILMNGDPVGPNYTIQNIDNGVTVNFMATAPTAENNNTIGKLTVTMSHMNLLPLSFSLMENAAAESTSAANGGLRLLVDLRDTNGMTVDWTDYHIQADDNA